MAANPHNLEVVSRRNPDDLTAPAYWCFKDRVTGTTIGKRYATQEEAQARYAWLWQEWEAELATPCALCKQPMSDHVAYQCPVLAVA